MTSRVLPCITCRDHLRNHISDFVEAFVVYYGEDLREEIEKAFSNVVLLAYTNPDHMSSLFLRLQEEISVEIAKEYESLLPSNLELKDLTKDYQFGYYSIMPIGYYEYFLKAYKEDPKGRRTNSFFKEIESILAKINPDITLENFSEYINSRELEPLNKFLDVVPEMRKKYDERIQQYQLLSQEIEYCNSTKSKLRKEYHIAFIRENTDMLRPEELEELEPYLTGKKSFIPFNTFGEHLFGMDITSLCSLDAFSVESEEILKDEQKPKWRKDSIKKQRIEFFKSCGIDLGDDYEAYCQSEMAKNRWPSFERVKQFQESKKKYQNQFNIKYYSNTPAHLSARKEIDSLGLLDKDDGVDASLYTKSVNSTFVRPNFKNGPNGIELCPLLFAECSIPTGHIDHFIVHELNHVLELHLQRIEYPNYQVICGWDVINGVILSTPEVDTINTDRSKRKYELFSEIIDEYIAQEISKVTQDKEIYVFDTKSEATYKHVTSYERYFFLVEDFFKEFKKEILASRRHGNMEKIFEVVSKELFDEFNDMINEFYEKFPNVFALFSLYESIKNGENDDNLKFVTKIREKKKELMQKMRMNSMVRTMQHVQEAEQKNESSL